MTSKSGAAKATRSVADEIADLMRAMGVPDASWRSGTRATRSPITGEVVAHVAEASVADVSKAVARSVSAYEAWRTVPAPRRGELVRLLGEELRKHKTELGRVVTLEAGKIVSEGLGEVQEMIDICDFAVGLSRQLYGLTIASERPGHRMMETWHPVGPVAIITAFNFPVAVWSWNSALALVCGNSVLWKPSEKTPLTALAVQALFERAVTAFGDAPEGLSQLLIGAGDIGAALTDDARVPVVSATGSTRMGRIVGEAVARRFGRSILELGGNNAAIVCPSADLDLSLRGIAFAAMGTAGQRCTSLRRLIVNEGVYDTLVPRLARAYGTVSIGDPREAGTLIGPLIDKAAYEGMRTALETARKHGATIHGGERIHAKEFPDAYYVRPALVEIDEQIEVVKHETFAPILYVLRSGGLPESIKLQNGVPQGLSSSIFTNDLREAEAFLSAEGSDCGIANVNIGPSGAEIGGAFGGEKETGGGREAGSDSWKAYMRRATNTINYSRQLPLAQGVSFDIED